MKKIEYSFLDGLCLTGIASLQLEVNKALRENEDFEVNFYFEDKNEYYQLLNYIVLGITVGRKLDEIYQNIIKEE